MILAMDTSSPRGSVALAHGKPGEQPSRTLHFPTGRARGGALFAALREILPVSVDDETPRRRLTAVIVGLGPGSFSGVRLAVAAAQGLALAHGARLRGRPSPEALATDAPSWHAVGDARRGLFYYAGVRGGRCERPPELLDRAGVLARVAAAPDGWPLLAAEASLALDDLPVTAFVPPDAARLLRGWETLPDTPLEPIYLRPPAITTPRKKMTNGGRVSGER